MKSVRSLLAVLLLPVVLTGAEVAVFPLPDGAVFPASSLEVSHAIAPETDQIRVWSKAEITPAGIAWNFSPRPRQTDDELILKNLELPLADMVIEVENFGPACQFTAYLEDSRRTGWYQYNNEVTLAAGTPEQGVVTTVRIPYHKWYVMNRTPIPRAAIALPVRTLHLAAENLQAGTEYALRIRKITLENEPLAQPVLTGWQMPENLTAGDRTALPDLSLATEEDVTLQAVTVVLQKDAFVAAHAAYAPNSEAPGRQFALSPADSLHVSEVAPEGKYQIRLVIASQSADGKVNCNSLSLGEVFIQKHAPFRPAIVAEVKPHGGVPMLHVNGIPQLGMAHATYCPRAELFRQFSAVGVELFSICATPTDAAYGLSPTAWISENEYDFSMLDERMALILAENPNALVFPRIHLHAPRWWLDAHPEACVVAEAEDGTHYTFEHVKSKPAPSWASDEWRQMTVRGLNAMLDHVASSPYANNVIGYHLASGVTEEWIMWGMEGNHWIDYSNANLQKFRTWLREKYGTEANLRKAWNNAEITFDTAKIPSPQERMAAQLGHYTDPAAAQNVIDFNTYTSWLTADTINYFAAAIKAKTNRTRVVGAFYGYLLQLCGSATQVVGGHYGLRTILESPDVDFLCSPTVYTFRQVGGEGTSIFMSLTASLQKHGKTWFDENDIRTSINEGGAIGLYGKPATLEGDLLQQQKEIANVITTGIGQYWFDVGYIRHDHPVLLNALGNYYRAAKRASELDRTPAAETAFCVDENSIAYLKPGDWLGSELFLRQIPQIQRSGLAVGHYLASDFDLLADHKLIVVSYAPAPDEATRAKLDALKNNHRVIVFLRDAGAVRHGVFDAKNASEWTGITLKAVPDALTDVAYFGDGNALSDAPQLLDCLAGVEVEDPQQRVPMLTLVPDDPAAEVLARDALGEPLIVVKHYPDWTAVYSAFSVIPPQLYRNLGTLAKAHHYIDTEDVVWANRSMVAVCVNQPGVRTIHLPRYARVRELYSQRVISDEPVKDFDVDFAAKSTMIFVLE